MEQNPKDPEDPEDPELKELLNALRWKATREYDGRDELVRGIPAPPGFVRSFMHRYRGRK